LQSGINKATGGDSFTSFPWHQVQAVFCFRRISSSVLTPFQELSLVRISMIELINVRAKPLTNLIFM
jgi:hypothetical protein